MTLLLAGLLLWGGYWGWPVLLTFVIPQRMGIVLLGFLFNWLPHHDLTGTARIDRFQASRVRVGWERLMTPLLLSQNYHLVHHINPAVPFYLLARTWKQFEPDYSTAKCQLALPGVAE
jgi:fatty acid desaturase